MAITFHLASPPSRMIPGHDLPQSPPAVAGDNFCGMRRGACVPRPQMREATAGPSGTERVWIGQSYERRVWVESIYERWVEPIHDHPTGAMAGMVIGGPLVGYLGYKASRSLPFAVVIGMIAAVFGMMLGVATEENCYR